jgi:hypothetical protein
VLDFGTVNVIFIGFAVYCCTKTTKSVPGTFASYTLWGNTTGRMNRGRKET